MLTTSQALRNEPSITMFFTFMLLSFRASSSAGTGTTVMSVRDGGTMHASLSYMRMPFGFTADSNFRTDGWLSASTASNVVTSGELMGLEEMMTTQFAVPPRISGPYEGIQET